MFDASLTCFFFFNDTATTEIYTLSLHDALPIYRLTASSSVWLVGPPRLMLATAGLLALAVTQSMPFTMLVDRKSTRLNSSHANISYAVFCLKKKKKILSHIN